MAAGRCGVLISLFSFSLLHTLFNRLKEVVEFSFNIGREEKQTRYGYKHRGFGKSVVFLLIYHPWINCSRKQRRSGKMKRHLSDWVIIIMCLLLSGDIHQCPGPVSRDFEGTISGDPDIRPRVSSSIADCWRDLLPCFETRDVIRMDNGVVDVFSTSEEGGRTPRPRAESVEEDTQLSRDQMTSEIKLMRDIGTLKGLHMVHLNVRSLLPKISELRHLCQESNVSLFGCSETWLDDSILDAEIHTYSKLLFGKKR